jgi:hypothetical protein
MRRKHSDIVRGKPPWVERLCAWCAKWKHEESSYYERSNGRRESICIDCQHLKRRCNYVASHEQARTYAKRTVVVYEDQPCALAEVLGLSGQLTKKE